jgi:hypothetical protein
MAQRTGTNILSLARIYAQDNDASGNFSTGAADALVMLNDVLMRWSFNVKSKPKYLAATTTGLSFSANDVYKETGDNTGSTMRISGFESFHPAAANSLSFPLPPALEIVTVDEIRELLGYTGDVALSGAASEWTHVAYEKTQDATSAGAEKWRVWAYPVINRTRYLTVRAPVYTQITLISDIPDIEEADVNMVARFLAFDIASLKKETDAKFLSSILAPVPPGLVQQMHGGAVLASQLQDRVEWRDW